MKKFMKAAFGKLKSNSGESISEVLVALLIAAVALVTLAGMITASGNLIDKSKKKIQAYVGEENKIVEQKAADSVGNGTVTVTLGGVSVALTDSSGSSVNVKYYKNAEMGGREVVSYKVSE